LILGWRWLSKISFGINFKLMLLNWSLNVATLSSAELRTEILRIIFSMSLWIYWTLRLILWSTSDYTTLLKVLRLLRSLTSILLLLLQDWMTGLLLLLRI